MRGTRSSLESGRGSVTLRGRSNGSLTGGRTDAGNDKLIAVALQAMDLADLEEAARAELITFATFKAEKAKLKDKPQPATVDSTMALPAHTPPAHAPPAHTPPWPSIRANGTSVTMGAACAGANSGGACAGANSGGAPAPAPATRPVGKGATLSKALANLEDAVRTGSISFATFRAQKSILEAASKASGTTLVRHVPAPVSGAVDVPHARPSGSRRFQPTQYESVRGIAASTADPASSTARPAALTDDELLAAARYADRAEGARAAQYSEPGCIRDAVVESLYMQRILADSAPYESVLLRRSWDVGADDGGWRDDRHDIVELDRTTPSMAATTRAATSAAPRLEAASGVVGPDNHSSLAGLSDYSLLW